MDVQESTSADLPPADRGARVAGTVVLVVVAAAVAATLWWSGVPIRLEGAGADAGAAGVAVSEPVGGTAALQVLREWDAARADAWSRGDSEALRALYAPRSGAGRRDVRMLAEWAARGLRVERMSMQVLATDVLDHGPTRLTVEVTDRLVAAIAVGEGGRRALPADRPSTRRLTFVRHDGVWVLARARDVPVARHR